MIKNLKISEITQKIIDESNGILNPVSEVRDEGKGYMMFDDGGVEICVGELLYGMIKILKPFHVLETGSYHGISSSYMGKALDHNGFGKIDTIEFEQKHIEECKKLWNTLRLNEIITPYLMSSLDFLPSCRYQFMFLDTEPDLRFAELVKFYPYLDERGYIFIHDAPFGLCQGNVNPDHPDFKSWPFGDVPDEMKKLLGGGDLVNFYFPNPRGMAGFYKPGKDDFYV